MREVIWQSSAGSVESVGLLTTKPHIDCLLTDGYKTLNLTRLYILRQAFYIGPSCLRKNAIILRCKKLGGDPCLLKVNLLCHGPNKQPASGLGQVW